MIHYCTKFFGGFILTLFSIQVFAESTINITVKTDEKLAAGIGYTVEGKESGGAGKSYVGKGPRNKTYSFGYRKKSIKGANISCGSLILTKDSNVSLLMTNNKCRSHLN
jgi:hypothetical protein